MRREDPGEMLTDPETPPKNDDMQAAVPKGRPVTGTGPEIARQKTAPAMPPAEGENQTAPSKQPSITGTGPEMIAIAVHMRTASMGAHQEGRATPFLAIRQIRQWPRHDSPRQ